MKLRGGWGFHNAFFPINIAGAAKKQAYLIALRFVLILLMFFCSDLKKDLVERVGLDNTDKLYCDKYKLWLCEQLFCLGFSSFNKSKNVPGLVDCTAGLLLTS